MLVEVSELCVEFLRRKARLRAVDGVSFGVDAGKSLALVGESGSGKSLTALSLPRLLPPSARLSGHVRFRGRDLLTLTETEMRAVRGAGIAMIFQEPMASLNPVMSVGAQVSEARHHASQRSRGAIRSTVADLLRRVGIPDADSRIDDFPHQMSGGMRQRVMIAMALAAQPSLLIADEPTTALDVSVQATILDLLRSLQHETGMALLLITHDLGVAATLSQDIGVMYAGRLIERAASESVLRRPFHPYTRGLLACSAAISVDRARRSIRLEVIPGNVPRLGERAGGCQFFARCSADGRDDFCRSQVPPLAEVAPGHVAACPKSLATAPNVLTQR